MKWSILSGDINWETYGGKLVAGPFDNGDFAYWLVLDIVNWAEAVGEDEASEIDGTHNVTLSVVAPSECPADQLQGAIDSCGWEEMELDSPLALVWLLHDYGIFASVWNENGSLKDLLRQGKQEAKTCEFLFGFYLDRPQNAIGSTGWDLLRGDLMAGITAAG